MTPVRIAANLLLGAVLITSCSERDPETGPTLTGGFSADVAAGKTSAVLDPVGDADKTAQDYQDIVGASITKKGGAFVFVLTLAAALPNNPALPSWADVADWGVALDIDPTAFPAGYPFTKNNPQFQEFFIEHRVYRAGFSDPLDPTNGAGVLTDRRPLLTGGQATITPVQVSIDGAKITWVVDAALLGDPSTFKWASFTSVAHAGDDVKNGYSNITGLDSAPNVFQGEPLATWPQ